MTTTLITNDNLKKFVNHYFYDKRQLPKDLRDKVLNDWDVSQVTDMSELFFGSRLNEPLNNWNVSNVENMSNMFSNCGSFNQPLNEWNVSNVSSMDEMFRDCNDFNQPLNTWIVSNVENMSYMFAGCKNFNQSLEHWNVGRVTDMNAMFFWCAMFNKPLDRWNVSNVQNMRGIFSRCNMFNQPLEQWDVGQVSNMELMFAECSNFNQALDRWNVSNVENMTGMFSKCIMFNQPLAHWDVGHVTNMKGMFFGCVRFNQALDRWNVSNVENMTGMFSNCPQMRAENKPRMLHAPPKKKTIGEKILEMCDGLVPVPIGNSSGTVISADATGWDVVGDEEVVIRDFLKKDAKNIVFLSNRQYYPMNKETLRNTILTNGSNIKYACSGIGGTAVLDVPYLNMKSVGLVVAFLVNIAEIMFVLKEPAVQAMELVSSGRTLETTISYEYLNGTDMQRGLGASHCQEGQGGTIANLQRVLTEETEVEVGEAIGKERGGVGGKRRRRKRTRKGKTQRTKTKLTKVKRTRITKRY